MDLPILYVHNKGIRSHVTFHDGLPLSLMSSRFIHALTSQRFIAFCCQIIHSTECVYHILFLHQLKGIWFPLAVYYEYSAAVNICVQVFVWFLILRYISRSGTAISLTFEQLPDWFSEWLYHLTFSISSI